jgi:hypothetical protein
MIMETMNGKQNAPPLVPGSRRGRPGRPRSGAAGIFGKPKSGHILGTAMQEPQARSGDPNGTQVQITVVPVCPRLLDLHAAAAYLGVSEWTVRDLEAAGTVPRIRIPLPRAGELRKLLFDRADLDRLIDGWKDARS